MLLRGNLLTRTITGYAIILKPGTKMGKAPISWIKMGMANATTGRMLLLVKEMGIVAGKEKDMVTAVDKEMARAVDKGTNIVTDVRIKRQHLHPINHQEIRKTNCRFIAEAGRHLKHGCSLASLLLYKTRG